MTLAAYECGSVDFPEPPYPDQIVCPQQNAPDSDAEQVGVEAATAVGSAAIHGSISLWTIISKVRLEACMWVSACYRLAVHVGTAKEQAAADSAQSSAFYKHFSWVSFGRSLY